MRDLRKKMSTALPLILLIMLCACTPSDKGATQQTARPSRNLKYLVALRPLVDQITINQMHQWEITVTSPSGEFISKAKIDVDGGMPEHNHGFPTQPKVTNELGQGRYLLDGMKFSMPGMWEIKISINANRGTDTVTFNQMIALPEVAPPSKTP